MTTSAWKQRLRALPAEPGVYLLKDEAGDVLYVGKATSLRHRVSSYFTPISRLSPKLQHLMARVADFEFLLTSSEQQALLLECNFIKKHRPRYNVRLKDDKSYPYLKLSLEETWPRLFVTRRVERDKGRYFGPFSNAGSVRQTLNLIRKLFPLRSCKKPITGNDSRPCLEYHLHRCLAPCIGAVPEVEYQQTVRQVILFLEGKQEMVVQQMQRQMEQAAASLEFEKAARLRDQIYSVEDIVEQQKVAVAEGELDAIAFAQARNESCVQVFFVRNRKLLGREHFILQGTEDEEPHQIMTSFVTQFYQSALSIPPLILLQHPVENAGTIRQWLGEERGGRVELQVPHRGVKKKLVDMVAENAHQGLEQLRVKLLSEPEVTAAALEELRRALQLPEIPRRMECYDVSNIQGTSAVGSMVVFIQGQPSKAHYRRFRIKTVAGANDYAMLQEILWRRFKKTAEAGWANLPQLVLIDGGKGQLNAALEVLRQLGLTTVPIASIAKEREEVFLPGVAEPVILPRNSPALHLLQRTRDEAHRFALGYYQRVHQKTSLASSLDAIPGIGAKRKRDLLRKFGSVRAIREAPPEEIAAVPGMTPALAQRVKEYL